ncbi:MAG: hypothetical protein JNJ46_24740 [Myxococcales bacterium]|nr:hypothetical protein [Myxococcales bacterium]
MQGHAVPEHVFAALHQRPVQAEIADLFEAVVGHRVRKAKDAQVGAPPQIQVALDQLIGDKSFKDHVPVFTPVTLIGG